MIRSKLHIDIETFSSYPIKTMGSYKYGESLDFEILMLAYAFDDEPVEIVDLALGEKIPDRVLKALPDDSILKCAHNAVFERRAFFQYGIDIPAEQWFCTQVLSAYSGLPLALEFVSKALQLEELGKLSTGKALIKYFCEPVKATKANGGRVRNFPRHDMEKWDEFKRYCVNDVEAEREICRILDEVDISDFERELYALDQKINDRGILIDPPFIENAITIDGTVNRDYVAELKDITGLANPNSPTQLRQWLSEAMQREITTLAKETLPELIEEAGEGAVSEALELRLKLAKTSIKKYARMIECECEDGRVRGLFQFYGANRTGRWAGRLVQMQNLPRNYMDDLDDARNYVSENNISQMRKEYKDVPDVLSQLIRTSFIAPKGKTFLVSDFSAIEARVIAWYADEEWRLEVFRTHGKIYEASASMMFGVPIEEIGKGSDLRDKGKVAELALGYQGAVGAMVKFGADKMGLSEMEMKRIVKEWRLKSPNIVDFWDELNDAAVRCVRTGKDVECAKGLIFRKEHNSMTIELPSGRKLYYREASLSLNQWGKANVKYKGWDQTKGGWVWDTTYGGKLAENVVQATARDLLAIALLRLDKAGFDLIMHVHDEAVAEVLIALAKKKLEEMNRIMGLPVKWAKGLPLGADGYISRYYKKD